MLQQAMQKISVYIISILLVLPCSIPEVKAQNEPPDTVILPLKIRAGIDLIGPAVFLYNNDNLNIEGFVSADLNAKTGIFVGMGYSNFNLG